MINLTTDEYVETLDKLIGSVYQILPLFEEKNEHLADYIYSLVAVDLIGAHRMSKSTYDSERWFNTASHVLLGLEYNLETIEHKQLRKQIFRVTNLLDSEKKRVESL